MKISNRVKRNLSLTLAILGFVCMGSFAVELVMDPKSAKLWFQFIGVVICTTSFLEAYRTYRRRVKNGILF